MVGDWCLMQGNMIFGCDVCKVYIIDDYIVIGIVGMVVVVVEFVWLYVVEFEYYEKFEGVLLMFVGKINWLVIMVCGNLVVVMQGLLVLLLLVGYDIYVFDLQSVGCIVLFDVVGGWNIEEEGYQVVGLGLLFVKLLMKKLYLQVIDGDLGLWVVVEVFYDVVDDDFVIGGLDLVWGIFLMVVIIDVDGVVDVLESWIVELVCVIIESCLGVDIFGFDGGEK